MTSGYSKKSSGERTHTRRARAHAGLEPASRHSSAAAVLEGPLEPLPAGTELDSIEEARTGDELTIAIHREAVRMAVPEVARFLQDHLGQQVTAFLSGLKDAKVVTRWINGTNAPRTASELRLREAYQAARLLTLAYGDDTAKSWFFGTNSLLGRSPASVLRSAETPDDTREVVAAAHDFVADEMAWRAERPVPEEVASKR